MFIVGYVIYVIIIFLMFFGFWCIGYNEGCKDTEKLYKEYYLKKEISRKCRRVGGSMKIETKYDIGQHIWFVYENHKEVCVYDDYIEWITYEDELLYGLKESCNDIKEEDVILYEDTENLINKIKEVMEEIRKNEKNV